MPVEELIGLEAAMNELGSLYAAARQFCALREPAEQRLLPRIRALGAELRRSLRAGSLDEGAVDAAAREIASLRDEWRERLGAIRSSDAYRLALDASARGDAEALAARLPEIFAGLRRTAPPASLFVAVPIAHHDRRPGNRPFLTESACVKKIAAYRRLGVPGPKAAEDWWETDFPCLVLLDDAESLEAPVQLRFDARRLAVPLFAAGDGPGLRCYTVPLRGPFSVSLQAQASDEWWEAFGDAYATYRDALKRELEQAGFEVEVRGG